MRRCAPLDLRAARRSGMTLIELMVVIVILTVLVGGVLPVLSPNNDARRIREAARGLQTYVMQAQARAARTGRPAGIAFRESTPGSGVALEVYQIEVPPPFAGFSAASASRVLQNPDVPNSYRIQFVMSDQIDLTRLPPSDGPQTWNLDEYPADQIPPKTVRPGDLVVVDGVTYRLTSGENIDEDGFYFGEQPDVPILLECELVDPLQTVAASIPVEENGTIFYLTNPKRYQIMRQPNAVTTSATPPYQLPAGVCIDLQASGTEGGSTPTQFTNAVSPNELKQVGIMFGPSSGIQSIYYGRVPKGDEGVAVKAYNGLISGVHNELIDAPIRDASKVYMLLGRVENGDVDISKGVNVVVGSQGGVGEGASIKERVAEMQNRVNWMNLDSRWIAIDARNGRLTVSENAFVDPSNEKYWVGLNKPEYAVSLQAIDARAFARGPGAGNQGSPD